MKAVSLLLALTLTGCGGGLLDVLCEPDGGLDVPPCDAGPAHPAGAGLVTVCPLDAGPPCWTCCPEPGPGEPFWANCPLTEAGAPTCP